MNTRASLLFFLVFSIFCYVPDIEVDNIVVEPGEEFYLKVNLSYVSKGYLELNLPKCFEYQEELYVGDVFNKRPFYLRVKSNCKEGLYLGNVTVRARDYYYGDNYRDVIAVRQFFIYVGKFPNLDYEPKIVVKGPNKIKFYSEGHFCVDDVCSEKEVEILKEIKREIEEFKFCFEKFKIRFCKRIKLRFYLVKPHYYIEDIGKNYIILRIYPKSFVCLFSKYPIIVKEPCKFVEGKVTFYFERKSSKYEVKFLNLTIGDYSFRVPIESVGEPKIEVLYGGIDYRNRKTLVIILNSGDVPAENLIIKTSEGYYFIPKLNPGEYRRLKIPYKFEHKIDIIFESGDKIYKKSFNITPKRVYFEEKRENFWEKIIPVSLFAFSIGMLVGRR